MGESTTPKRPDTEALVERLRLAASTYDAGGLAFERDLATWAADEIEELAAEVERAEDWNDHIMGEIGGTLPR